MPINLLLLLSLYKTYLFSQTRLFYLFSFSLCFNQSNHLKTLKCSNPSQKVRILWKKSPIRKVKFEKSSFKDFSSFFEKWSYGDFFQPERGFKRQKIRPTEIFDFVKRDLVITAIYLRMFCHAKAQKMVHQNIDFAFSNIVFVYHIINKNGTTAFPFILMISIILKP